MTQDLELHQLAEHLGAHLHAQQLRLVTAESCTGGWLAEAVTAVSGSSAWFECGLVTYSNAAKQKLLGVDAQIITRAGAVSEPTATAMAHGALQVSGADISVAITGIAGPGGASDDKPVGTVWFATQLRDRAAVSRQLQFTGDRFAVRRQAVITAMEMLMQCLAAQHSG